MLVRAESVTKSFGPKEILMGVNVQINEGDRIALVGPNGAGKTTLLKILMGEVRPDTGELTIKTDKICYLSQFPVVDQDVTVHQTLTSLDPAMKDKMDRIEELESIMASGDVPTGMDWNDLASEYSLLHEEIRTSTDGGVGERTKETLEQFGLSSDKANDKLAHLSGGERTKVMLTKVLSRAERSDLLILDEPTSHLDIEAVEWLEDYLLDFKGSVLVVSHDRYFLDRVVTQVYELDGGKLRHYGGNYSQFVDKKAMDMERQRKEYEKNQLERERQSRIAEQQHQMLWFASTHKTRLKMLERLGEKEPPREQKDLKVMITAAQKSGKNCHHSKKIEDLKRRQGRPEGY